MLRIVKSSDFIPPAIVKLPRLHVNPNPPLHRSDTANSGLGTSSVQRLFGGEGLEEPVFFGSVFLQRGKEVAERGPEFAFALGQGRPLELLL